MAEIVNIKHEDKRHQSGETRNPDHTWEITTLSSGWSYLDIDGFADTKGTLEECYERLRSL